MRPTRLGRTRVLLVFVCVVASTWWSVRWWASGPEPLTLSLNTFYEDGEAAFSPDGRTIATPGIHTIPPFHQPFPEGLIPEYGATQGLVELRDAATGTRFAALEFKPIHGATSVFPILFSPDGSMVVAGNWSEDRGSLSTPLLNVWEVASGRLRATLELPSGSGREAAFSPDGRILTVLIEAQRFGPRAYQILRWETSGWKPIEGMAIPASGIYGNALGRGGEIVATTQLGGNLITLYDVPLGRVRARLSPRIPSNVIAPSRYLQFSPDGRILASSGRFDGVVELWDVPSATYLVAISPPADGQGFRPHRVGFSPDGRTLALGDRHLPTEGSGARLARAIYPYMGLAVKPLYAVGRVTLYDVVTGKRRSELDGAQSSLSHLTFSPDGRTLVTDGTYWPERQPSGTAKVVDMGTSGGESKPDLDRWLIFRPVPAIR